MENKYLIYKINNSQFNDDPDYLFKTSKAMAEEAVEVDQARPASPFQGEEAYFDGSHFQCVGYKPLALLIHHPVKWCILRSDNGSNNWICSRN